MSQIAAASDPLHGPVRVTMDQRLGDGSWATADEVAIVCEPRRAFHCLRDMDGYGGWWPWMHVHLAAGVGSEGTMAIGPWRRPRWRFRITEVREPSFIQYELAGDLAGRAAWEIEPHGATLTAVRYCWYAVVPASRLVRLLVRLTEVRWHHLWVRMGLLGLKERLEREESPENPRP